MKGTAAMRTREEIYSKVSAILVDVLGVDAGDISPSATLQGDLGAESIDFLDLVFRLERDFDIRIPRDELFPELIFEGDPECVRDGRVNEKGLRVLREAMPFADLGAFEKDPHLGRLGDLFTVDLITRYLEDKLGRRSGG
jgi:acyl carrier protein